MGAGAHVGARGRRPRPGLALGSEAPLGHAAADLGGDDHDERDGDDDDRHGDHLRQLARKAQRSVEVDGECHRRALDERGHGVLVERRRECDQIRADDRGQDQGERDRAERAEPARAQVVGRLFERRVDLLEPRDEHEHRVRQRDHDVADDDGPDAEVEADGVEEQEQRDPEDDERDDERAEEECGEGAAPPEAVPHERERREDAEDHRAEARQGCDLRACQERALEIGIREELVVPVEREAAERERGEVRVVEREDQEQHDRRIEEDDDEGEERPQYPRRRSRERDVHQSVATCRAWRKREKTIVSRPTTTSRKSASTAPVRQSGKPVPKRSTIWFPYM